MQTRMLWLSLVSVGCLDMGRAPDQPPTPVEAAPAPEAEASAATATAAAPAGGTADAKASLERKGKVLEVLKSGGYTYVRLDACGMEAWAAGPEMDLEVGTTVAMPEGMGMVDFKSPSLDRTFEAILFVDWFRPTTEELDCSKPALEAAEKRGAHGSQAKPLPKTTYHGKVLETMESGGYTYVRIDSCGEEQWLASPRIPVQVGQFVASPQGNEMRGFSSPTLGRTFESIFFVPSMGIAPGAPDCG